MRNRLLRLMPAEDFALLAAHLTFHKADRGATLFPNDATIVSVWFMDSGIGSLVTVSPEGHRVESGIFGREGFGPTALVMGSDVSPYLGQVQLADDCWRMDAGPFKEAIGRSRGLHALLLRYTQTLSTQMAYTGLAGARHTVEERLTRWLLMCHDRIDGDDMALTHEFMAIMLAVRRPTVTTALHVLEGNGFIRAERGCIIIRNRAAMEDFARDIYGPPEREYERLIGPFR